MNGASIRQMRESLGLRQHHLAALLGVSNVTVCHWERGKAAPTAYQQGVMKYFERAGARIGTEAAARRRVAEQLVSAGPVAVLAELLALGGEAGAVALFRTEECSLKRALPDQGGA